jgi:uncharacterized protein YndB with AHSA1/START domain
MSTATATTSTDKKPTTTHDAPIHVYRVFIKATPQAIWDAITKPEWSEKYGYQARTEYELRRGGSFRAITSTAMKAFAPHMPDVMIVGEVIESDPPRKLVQTWHPVWDEAAAAEAPTRLTYEIEEIRGTCSLTVTHDLTGAPGLVKMVSGQIREAGGGWPWTLSDLKTLLETGSALGSNLGPA